MMNVNESGEGREGFDEQQDPRQFGGHGFGRGGHRGAGRPGIGGPGFDGQEFDGAGHRGWGQAPGPDSHGPRMGFQPQGPGREQGPDGPGQDFGFGGPGGGEPRFGGQEGPMGGFGPGGMGGGRGPRGGGHRRGPGRGRRGDVRNAILALLSDEDLNGYGMINAIAEKSNGLWRPSPGSIYPALGLLEDEGLIEATTVDGKKAYTLSEAGRSHVAEHAEEISDPWDRVAQPYQGFLDVRGDLRQLEMAVQQVVVTSDREQIEAARKLVERARKDIYRLLAGDAPTDA